MPYSFGKWISALDASLTVHGLAVHAGENFFRLPECVAMTANAGARELYGHTAGRRVRFRTDSDYPVMRAALRFTTGMFGHMPLSGHAGLDLYQGTSGQKRCLTSAIPWDPNAGKYGKWTDLSGALAD